MTVVKVGNHIIPAVSGKASNSSLFDVMLAVGMLFIVLIVLRKDLYISSLLKAFIKQVCCILSSATMWFLLLILLTWCNTYAEHSCRPMISLTWSR